MNRTIHVPASITLLIVVLINVLKDLSDFLVTYVTNAKICPKKDKNKAISNTVIIIYILLFFSFL